MDAAISIHENTSAEMSQVARQANSGKLGGQKPDNSLSAWNHL